MVARTYDRLGGIAGVQTNADAPYSMRGNDRDRFQNFIFECDPLAPYSGTVLVEISQDDPSPLTTTNSGQYTPDRSGFSWSTIAKLEFFGERDPIFTEFELEAAHVRLRGVKYNANALISSSSGGVVGGTGAQQFTIDAAPAITVNPGDDLNDVLTAITGAAVPNISASIDTTSQTLIIEKTDGSAMILADVTGSPLEDIGVLKVDDAGTYTAAPNGRITQVKTMR